MSIDNIIPSTIKRLSSNKFIEDMPYVSDDGALFEDSFVSKVKEGHVVEGTITRINANDIIVDIGLKSDGRIPIKELGSNDEIAIGVQIKVYVERIEDYNGNVILSREKAIRDDKWNKLGEDLITKSEVSGVIKRPIKCGFIVDLGEGINAFLPLTHIDLKQIKDASHLINTPQKFIILKMDKKQANIVVSRKLVLEKSHASGKAKFLESLNEGDIIEGKVKSMLKYGVFVGIHESEEAGIIDGLVYITDISYTRVNHPSEVFDYGQNIKVKIIKIDRENSKVSLGIKQLGENPWHNVESKYPIGSTHKGHVASKAYVASKGTYGLFVELEPGVEGLVHSSEVTWVRSNLPVCSLVNIGQEVQVKVLGIDMVKNRMSLSIKECISNPWQELIDKYPIGSVVSCKVKNNAGSYISVGFCDPEIDENVDGVIYARDLSWSKSSADEIKKCHVGDIIEAKIIRANVNRTRVYLGVKQIDYDPLEELIRKVEVGDVIQVNVNKREENGLVVEISNDLTILIEPNNLPENRKFTVSEKISVKVLGIEKYKVILSAK